MNDRTTLTDSSVRKRVSPLNRLRWAGRRLLPVGLFFLAGIALIVILGWAQRRGFLAPSQDAAATGPMGGAPGAIYTCPMHPQIRQPGAGRCPICGMALVPASNAAAELDEFSVRIEPAQRRLANIQTAPVESAPLEAMLQTIGVIAVDESRQASIAAYVDGRLERLYADYTGIEIRAGDHLAIIYSPQLYGAQVEFVEARRALAAPGGVPAIRQAQESLVANTRQRLREFGMSDEQLAELERVGTPRSRLTIYAPQGGTVVEKLAVEGSYVKAGEPIYRVAELSTVWLMLKLFPEDATRVRFGQRVEAVVQSLPGEKLPGRVAFIDPTVDLRTRTVGVRVELINDGRLRPGDYAEATITLPIGLQGDVFDADLAGKWISPMHPQIIRDLPGECPICGMALVPTSRYGFVAEPVPQPKAMFVPRSAVLLAGGNSVVYVESQPGLFEIRPVVLGPILRDRIVILDGLQVGEQVATAGNFLIDSQMQLAGKPSLIDVTRALSKVKRREGPLQFEPLSVASIGGESGAILEQLYTAYFELQLALASDSSPPESASHALHAGARSLASDRSLAEPLRQLAREITAASEHLPHLDLKSARREFKSISRAVVTLASKARGDAARAPFTHFYCPMVPGGGGDWLQRRDELSNPYFGSEMLRCGEKVQVFPAVLGSDATEKSLKPERDSEPHPSNELSGRGKGGC